MRTDIPIISGLEELPDIPLYLVAVTRELLHESRGFSMRVMIWIRFQARESFRAIQILDEVSFSDLRLEKALPISIRIAGEHSHI